MLGQSSTAAHHSGVREDGTGSHAAKDVVVPLKHDGSGPSAAAQGRMPVFPAVDGVDGVIGPVLLALALAFILALASRPSGRRSG